MEKKIQELEKENKQLKLKLARLESENEKLSNENKKLKESKKESVKATFKKTYTKTEKKGLEIIITKEKAINQVNHAKKNEKTFKVVGTLPQLESGKIEKLVTENYTLELNKKKVGK